MFRSLSFVLALAAATPVSAATVKVMTFNTHHGGTKTTPPTTDGEIDTIAAENPDVVVMQEAYASQLSYYVDGLNARQGTSAWHGIAAKHCKSGTQPTCTSQPGESTMIVTKLKTISSDTTLIWANDDYWVARASAHMTVAAADGTTFNVFVCHTPAMSNYAASRAKYVSAFLTWADTFAGPRFVGGDFNEGPTNASIVAMKTQFADAWATGGSGSGYTHPNPTATSRIDYWFSSNGATLNSVHVVADLVDSDHRPVVADYTLTSSTPTTPPQPSQPPSTGTETTLLQDALSTLDATKWSKTLFTGSQDTTINVAASGSLQVGPLKAATTGSHYNGITSGSFNLGTHGYASVQLAQAPNTATLAYAFFAVGTDANNFYRWYESGDSLVIEKKLAGGKTTVLSLPYDATTMQFLKIAIEYNSATGTNDVVFSTAPNNNGAAGTYTERHRETWSAHVNSGAVKVELKAGTSDSVVSPGTTLWSNARVATIN